MSFNMVHVRELTGWGLDDYEYRPSASAPALRKEARDRAEVSRRGTQPSDAVLTAETAALGDAFLAQAKRADLLAEMSGLSWSLGVVDLRALIAFQRRLAFNPGVPQPAVPTSGDWDALFAYCFGPSKPVEQTFLYERSVGAFILRSENPNLHLRSTSDPTSPFAVHAGSPFLEVARLRERWFLRDGYHRAYALLRGEVFQVPAVIVEAATMEELGASQPWFFSEDVLFSDRPPRVIDFLNEDHVIEYDRPPLIKTLRITVEESLKPATIQGETL